MKVGQLMALLDNMPADMEVVMASPSGDYWGTVLGLEPKRVEFGAVRQSVYHNALAVVEENEDTDGEYEAIVIYA